MVRVRIATLHDVARISVLATRTFRETFVEDFAMPYTASDLATHERESYGVDALSGYLRDSRYRHFIAERDDFDEGRRGAVGYALAGPNGLPHADHRDGDGELKRIYVVREAQATGAGRALFDAALGWLGDRRVWIGVWSGNLRAQRFYERRGFAKVGAYDFRVGETLDHEFILRRG
jgi:ribosomal protein S18 acetylase RimI-like enzyme